MSSFESVSDGVDSSPSASILTTQSAISDHENLELARLIKLSGNTQLIEAYQNAANKAGQKRDITIKYSNKVPILFEDFEQNTTLEALQECALAKWEDTLLEVDFCLYWEEGTKEHILTSEKSLKKLWDSAVSVLKVKLEVKGFSDFKMSDAYQWAGVNGIDDDASQFQRKTLDMENSTTQTIMQHALDDIMAKNEFYGPITDCAEASVREFISPVLLAVARLSGDVKLSAEMFIRGKKGHGPLDFAFIYQKFFVLITEAKKDNLKSGLYQNIGQMCASREAVLAAIAPINNKRKYMDMAPQLSSIPSTGIISTGKEWILLRYHKEPAKIWKSQPMAVSLVGGDKEKIFADLRVVVETVLGALALQKDAIDTNPLMKKMRSN